MRPSRIMGFLLLLACGGSAAQAQYGLYGSPDMLRLPQPTAQDGSVPQAYPTTPNPSTAPVPPSAYPAGPAYQTASAGNPQQNIYSSPAGQSPSGDYPSPQLADGAANPTPAGQGGGSGNGGTYRGACDDYERSAHGNCASGPAIWQPCACCQWYASLDALVMTRSDGRGMWMSYNSASLPTQGNNTLFGLDSGWGGEVQFGRRFCWNCVPCALELTYWTTTDLTGSSSASYPGSAVNTVLATDFITFHTPGGDAPANAWFYGAGEQTLARQDEFQDLEVNLIREQLPCACDSPWDIGWSLGIRYFRFQDKLTYDSIMPGGLPGTDAEASLSDCATNNLVGVQVGCRAAYNIHNGLRLFIEPKVGIYDNFLESNFQAQLGNGTEGYSQPYNQFYPVHGSRDAVAFLAEINLGAEWQFSRNWSANVGYRVVAATGIGFADDQFPQYICDVPQLSTVSNPSSLVLHGAFVGVSYCF